MKILQLTPYARARVWFGNAVPEYSAAAMLTIAVEAVAHVQVRIPRTTVEAFVPRGAFAEYGLLGMRFEKAADGPLRIEVPCSNGDDRWPEALGERAS